MDDVQRGRMERNRQSALLRLHAQNLHNGGDQHSEACEQGASHSQPNSSNEILAPNSLDAFECTNTNEVSSPDVEVGEEVPRLLPKRLRVDTSLTQSTLSSSLAIMRPSQDFDYLIAIDFEATCDNSMILHPQEIVEFPAILVNLVTRKFEAVFHTFVKPVYHPKLTDFCKRFLGIQQDQVDNGVLLGKALKMFDAWLEENEVKNKRFVVATWSDWDCRTMLDSECLYKGLQKPLYFNRWINLKIPHREIYGNVRANFKQSVELMGLKFEGRPHSGLDDAKNTAYLALELIRRGTRLRVTGWLKGYDLNGSKSAFPLSKKRKKRAFAPK